MYEGVSNNNKKKKTLVEKQHKGLWRQNSLDSQSGDTTEPSSRELYHLQFSLQSAIPEIFGYTLVRPGR
jgi:hypothetical protein